MMVAPREKWEADRGSFRPWDNNTELIQSKTIWNEMRCSRVDH